MKKILSLLLAVVMILSVTVNIVSAVPYDQCLYFNDSAAYMFLNNMQLAATNSVISFDLAWQADENGAPVLALNAGSFTMNTSGLTAGGKTLSYDWGAVEATHWRKVELAFTGSGLTLSLDGTEIGTLSGIASRNDGFVFVGFPGDIYVDNFKAYTNGTLLYDINFEDEGTYVNHKSSDATVSRTNVPEGSYYDYEEVILPDNVEYIFDSDADCEALTIGSEETILVGDLNLDSKINSRDVMKLKKLTVNAESFDIRLADFDYNGSINSKDSLFLKQTASGKRAYAYKTYGSAEAVPFEATQLSAKLTASAAAADGVEVTLTMDAIDAASYPFAVITYMTPNSEADKNSEAAIESAFGAYGNLVSYELTTDGKYHSAIVDLSEVSTWNGDKATLKFFTAANEGDTLYLDSIVFVASQARANAVKDARESAKRTYGIYDKVESSGLGEYVGNDYLINFDSEAKMDYVSNGNNSKFSYDESYDALKAQTTSGADPSIYVDLSAEGISADTYKYIVYTYHIPTTTIKEGPKVNMYYVCGEINVPTGGYESDVYSCTKGSQFVTQIIDLSAKSNWSGDIKGLRIDYFTDATTGDVAYIDSLVFCSTLGEANTAARLRLEDRYGVAQVDTAGVWNTYWNYYMNANNYEFIAGSASNLQMYFRFNTSKLTARSLGDRFARAITNATGYEVTCEVYAGYFDLKNNGSANVKYILTYEGESYIVWLYTNIISDSSYSDALDGTSDDVEPSYPNLGTWGVSVSDVSSFPVSSGLSNHSNHEVRLVSTPYGDFAVLPTSEDSSRWADINAATFTLFRIYDNGSTKSLGSWNFAYHTSKPNVFYNKNDGLVYVVCTDDQGSYMSNLVLYFDPASPNSDGSYNISGGRTSVSYQGGAAPSGYGYIQPILDEVNNKIYALACGGKDAGYFGWGIYNCKSKSWEGSKFSTVLDTYRHCYVYGFSDGNKGFYVVAGRDVLLYTLGLAGTVYGADYAWDEVNLFHFPSAYSTGYTRTTVIPADYTQMARSLFPSACNNNAGDTYITTDGKLHVLGAKAMHGNFHHDGKYDEMWHAVYDVSTPGMKPVELYNYPISFGNPDIGYSMRMAEDTKGGVYIVAMPKANSCRAEIWKATDDSQTKFEIVGCRTFSTSLPSNSFILTNTRNGSVIDGKIGCFYPVSSSGGYVYKYFTVQVD